MGRGQLLPPEIIKKSIKGLRLVLSDNNNNNNNNNNKDLVATKIHSSIALR